jgi:hypothetical protein
VLGRFPPETSDQTETWTDDTFEGTEKEPQDHQALEVRCCAVACEDY